MVRNFVLTLFLVTLFATSVEAATLFGRVVEVNDGDVITVFNLNRPVRVKLLAVDAPEADQAFGDVARKHLSYLVYDKSVVVEYSGIAADSSLVGRVMLDNADIGAQMIRDGAAWFDPNNQSRLSATHREVYQQSEQAARNERRGLWQAETPVAPWEFVRAQLLRRDPVASPKAVTSTAKSQPNRPTPELTNLSLMRSGPASMATPNMTASDAEAENLLWASAFEDSGPKKWKPFRPENENFTVDVPDGGVQKQVILPMGERMVAVTVFAARDSRAVYVLMWITGPTFGESDKSAITSSVHGFLNGFTQGYQRHHKEPFTCEARGARNMTVNGFSGSDFDIPSCTIPAKLRLFTRTDGGERRMYIGAVFYEEAKDPNVSRFIKSFTVNTSEQ